MDNKVSAEVQKLVDHLHLPESEILELFSFKLDEEDLTQEQAMRFIHLLKTEFSNKCTH